MVPNKGKVIEVNIDFKNLGVILLISIILVFSFFSVRAQSGDPPSTNNDQVDSPVNSPEQIAPEYSDVSPSPGEGYLLTTNGEWILPESIGKLDSTTLEISSLSAIGAGNNQYYLTSAVYYPDQALTACSAGYHMASLWEILDVSNLTYDYDHPAAVSKADSGFGPPSNWYGWVRTGYDSSPSSVTGTGNCNNWTSRLITDYGVSVKLSFSWEIAPGDISTWDATSFTCNYVGPVWCIGD
jgi:hypothetical protein